MNKNIDEMLKVLLAYKEGKAIESKRYKDESWWEDKEPTWNFGLNCYRIKPEKLEEET